MGVKVLVGLGLWRRGRGRLTMKEKTGRESLMMMDDGMRYVYMVESILLFWVYLVMNIDRIAANANFEL